MPTRRSAWRDGCPTRSQLSAMPLDRRRIGTAEIYKHHSPATTVLARPRTGRDEGDDEHP